jgi:3',5'-cyclic AMP phosphodiesterase CpdA
MLLAQISDLHVVAKGRKLYDAIDTPAFLARAVAHLNALAPRPDFVWITGDLVDQGSPAEYAHLRELLRPLQIQWALMPGNHDERAALRQSFADQPYLPASGEFLQYTIEHLPLRLLALDTLIPGESGGRLCQARLDWLADQLERHPDRPAIIAMHHPPFLTGIAEMDTINCANSAALGALVAEHPQIERIICGHVHRSMAARWNGTVVTTAPATAHQVALDLREGSPTAWIMEPPACHLHYWREDTGLVTHTSYIGDYGPATPY